MTFTDKFGSYACEGDTIECVVDGFTVRARIVHDPDHGAPWDEEDGHGPVSDWTRRDKRPGERILSSGMRSGEHRFYDFAEAVKIAKRDRWGSLPGDLKTACVDGVWRATAGDLSAEADDVNVAIRSLFDQYKAKLGGPGAYAVAAVEADFARLKAWCDDEWFYVGVVLSISRGGIELDDHAAALWGIESDAGDYLTEVANELLTEALEAGRAALARLIESV